MFPNCAHKMMLHVIILHVLSFTMQLLILSEDMYLRPSWKKTVQGFSQGIESIIKHDSEDMYI